MTTTPRTREQCLSSLAHELRNPLASILSCVEVMNSSGNKDMETRRLLDVIDHKAMAMASVLDNFLSVVDDAREALDVPIAVTDELSQDNAPAKESVKSPSAGFRVLIVDDNETAADNLGQLLALRGYDVQIAHGGQEGIQKAVTFLPQAAILDIEMPDIDGYKLAKMIQGEHIACSCIALTGYGHLHDKQKAKSAGFSFHLTKPSRLKDVEAILEQIARSISI